MSDTLQRPPKKPLSDFAVSDTHIIYFVPGKTPEAEFTNQDKTDVVDSTLLAQLTAISAANSVEEADEWITKYTEMAAVAAWVLQSGSNFKTATKDMISVSLDITAIKLLLQKESTIETSGVLEALLYLKGKDPVGLDILNDNGKTANSGSFQLAVCEKNSDGDIAMKLMPFVFETTETVVSGIFQPVQDAGHYTLKYMSNPTILVLNLQEYARLRETIQKKLVGYVDDYITYLPL